MVAGTERYYQIARCYRDEDFRADRQPEFTQLDIEMSFVEQDDVIELGEVVTAALWSELAGYEIPRPIPRLTYAEAMARYGSDKPDLRFGIELTELTDYFADTSFRVFQAPYVGAVVMPGGADQPRRQFDAWQEWAKQRGARGLAYVTVGSDGELGGPVAKNLSERRARGPGQGHRAPSPATASSSPPGTPPTRARCSARPGTRSPGGAVWSTRVPGRSSGWSTRRCSSRFRDDAGRELGWTAVHHPFTSPNADWMDRFEAAPDQALAFAYDIVCNGNEIGGGSIRIHRSDVQQRVFALLGMDEAEQREKFGFLLDAFAYGPPPHGGIAFGWDRICMLLAGADSLRDVIAFPKTGGGYDPLTAAPAPITAEQRREAGVDAPPAAGGRAPGHRPRGSSRVTSTRGRAAPPESQR